MEHWVTQPTTLCSTSSNSPPTPHLYSSADSLHLRGERRLARRLASTHPAPSTPSPAKRRPRESVRRARQETVYGNGDMKERKKSRSASSLGAAYAKPNDCKAHALSPIVTVVRYTNIQTGDHPLDQHSNYCCSSLRFLGGARFDSRSPCSFRRSWTTRTRPVLLR